MRFKKWGNEQKLVSELTLGTWAFGGSVFGNVTDQESIATIHFAEDMGINALDSAPFYSGSEGQDGRAERVIGKALNNRREKWNIMTKFGRHIQKGKPWWDLHFDFSGNNAIASCNASLSRLQTDYLDALYVHSPVPKDHHFDPEDTFSAMIKLKKQGKIRNIGFSFGNETAETIDLVKPYLLNGTIDVVQIRYHLMHPEPRQNLFPLLSSTKVSVFAREVLGGGMLIDKFDKDLEFPKDHRFAKMPKDVFNFWADNATKFEYLKTIHQNSMQILAHQWPLSQKDVTSVVTGCKNRNELKEVLETQNLPHFLPETLLEIEKTQNSFYSFS